MKVALTHMRQRGTGGTERYLNQVAAHLAEHGHDVTIVCRSHEQAPHPAVSFVVLRPFAIGAAWRMWSFARAVESHVRAVRYDVVFGLGKTWSQDVIRLGGGCHETYLELAHHATVRWKKSRGTQSIKHRLAIEIERRALRPWAYRRIITNSDMVRRDVCRRYSVPPELVSVIYNGVDLERFHPRRKSAEGATVRRSCGFESSDFVVLFLGTGYGRKGLDRLLDAFPPFLAAHPQARLLIVGYDSAQRHFERMAGRLGLKGRVVFAGGQRNVEAYFAAADLYVLPTRYDPFANTTLEALASGIPVITTAQNGASEIIRHRTHGSVLAAEAGTDDLTRELSWWAQSGRAADGGLAARIVAESHSARSTAEATAEILQDVAQTVATWSRRRGDAA